MKAAPIGVFDSGLGGLTVAKAILDLLPNESIIYFGDTLHLPYGEKSAKHIRDYSEAIVSYLLSQQVKLIVIACNTASAVSAGYLREKYHSQIEIRGVIRPLLSRVATKNYQQVGLIGTQTTIDSNIYPTILAEYNTHMQMQCLATPLLVPIIEEGFAESQIIDEVLKQYLSNLKNIDALLLACTHYPLIKKSIEKYYNWQLDVLDNAAFMAEDVKSYLEKQNLLSTKKSLTDKFLVSDYTNTFAKSASMFMGKTINVEERNIFASV